MIEAGKIGKYISNYSDSAKSLSGLYKSYTAESLAIHRRSPATGRSSCNKLANDWRGLIVDQCVGYMFGSPISYSIAKDAVVDEKKRVEYQKTLDEFLRLNSIEDLDSETGEMCGVCGFADRLLRINSAGEITIMLLEPWNTIRVTDRDGNETDVIYCYQGEDEQGNSILKAEVYDKNNIYFYKQINGTTQGNTAVYVEDRPSVSHNFIDIPVVRFLNNSNMIGDFEKVNRLIDSYDKLVSNNQDELDEFRQAYLTIIGASIASDEVRKMRETGVIELPEDSAMSFLIKDINCEFNKHQLEVLKSNIYRFSKTVDMGDSDFSGGGQTGESRKWKLLGLENKAKKKERKFVAGLRDMFYLVCGVWKSSGIDLNYNDIRFSFTRNLPVELITAADVASKIAGIVSQRTLVEQMPFVTDVEEEMRRIEDEKTDYLDIDSVGGEDAE